MREKKCYNTKFIYSIELKDKQRGTDGMRQEAVWLESGPTKTVPDTNRLTVNTDENKTI